MAMRMAGAAALMAVAVGGCGIEKADEHARQLNVIGGVEVSTVLCTGGDVDEESHGCAPYTRPQRGQVLVAYRIPDGSAAPASLTDDGGLRHFSPSDSYTSFLEETYPESGMKWAGYVSDVYSSDTGGRFAATLSPDFPLPEPGKPFAGPFRYFVVGGYRTLLDPAEDGSAPVDCADTETTSCTSTGSPGEDALLPTRDLAVLPGESGAPAIEAGGHGTVPFDLQLAGTAGEGVRFELGASTELGGAHVALGETALEPEADSHNPVGVDVAVPAGTEPGTYEVTLTATAVWEGDVIIHKPRAAKVRPGGVERRSGTMTFRVVAPPPPPPVVEPPPVVVPPVVRPPVVPPPPVVRPPVVAPPSPPEAPRRARLRLSLAARPRHAYSDSYARYRVVVRNASRVPAIGTRVCERLPASVQFVRASRRVRFVGRELCFGVRRLRGGSSLAARVVVHVDTDARPGLVRAQATASASNADRARARARMRVMRRPVAPRPAPVTG